MINKIIAASLFFFFLIALSIKLIDDSVVYVNVAPSFMTFLKMCSLELNDYKIEVPNIPMIQPLPTDTAFLTGFYNFVNALSTFLNVVILLLNTLIEVLQFIFILIKNLTQLRDGMIEASDSVPSLF